MSLMSLPACDEPTFAAIFRQHAPSSPHAERYAICHVQFYEDVLVLARTEAEARDRALTKCGIDGDMRRKVQVTFVRWCDGGAA